jgi:hypothetical protein
VTLYRMVAGSSYCEIRWFIQRSVSLFSVHLFWWTMTVHYEKQEAEWAFAELTAPGKYGERL